MMKPKFADGAEFVRDGQKEPELEKMLSAHPDGLELLKQARFICKMLEKEAKADRGTGIAASFSLDSAVPDRIAEMMSAESAPASKQRRMFSRSEELRGLAPKRSSIDQMISRAGGRNEDLGAQI